MEQQGISPDAIAFAIPLNAYIDAGDWTEASKFWQRLPPDIQADHNIVNVLLKGMVILSAPFAEVYRVFSSAFPDNSQADQRAWTLLIQSACDSGDLPHARELYQDFKRLTRFKGSKLYVDHFLASILIVGHIRYGEIAIAKRLQKNLEQVGAKNTSVTYAVVIDGALRGRWPMTAASAKELGFRLLAESEALERETSTSRGRPVENIVAPLIQSAIRDGDIAEVEHLFAITLEKEAQPSVLLYTMLLDAYRHAGEHDRVQQVWDAIRNTVVEQEATFESPIGHDSRLCIPLSIYIDAMSAANRHEDVLRTWADLRERGFGFDSHNWNHLAVSLLRNGEVLKAFDIVENVLIKRQEELKSREYVGIRPEAAFQEELSLDLSVSGNSTALQEHLLLDPAHRPPNRRHEHRDDAVAYRALRLERTAKADRLAPPAGLNFDPNVFEKWRPTDAMWRPSYLTMASLDKMYSELEHGRSSMFALMAEEEEDGEFGRETDGDVAPSRTRHSSPPALLAKINSKYAKTVSLIMLHRRKKADRAVIRKKAVTSTSETT
jgi:pentatricopeptide repeat-containing protein PET309